MRKRNLVVLATLMGVFVLVLVPQVQAQDDADNTEGIVGNELPPTMEDKALAWLDGLMVGLVAVGPVGAALVQVWKFAAKQMRVPRKITGFVVIGIAAVLVGLAFTADVFDRQHEVGTLLGAVEQVATTVLAVLSMFASYKFGKVLKVTSLPAIVERPERRATALTDVTSLPAIVERPQPD